MPFPISNNVTRLASLLIRVELKHFSVNMRFLANYVQSDDFCFFSSRKRRKNICFSFVFPVFIPPRHSQQTRDRLPGSIPAILSLKTGRQEYSIDGGESGSRREA